MTKRTRIVLIVVLLMLSGFLGFIISLYLHPMTEEKDVQLIQTFHYPAIFVKQLEGDPEAGRKIFQEFCSTCHANPPRIDIRAPRIGDKQAWKIRRAMGMDALLKITTQGAGAMPARGGCFECSDEQLRQTIRYMLQQS